MGKKAVKMPRVGMRKPAMRRRKGGIADGDSWSESSDGSWSDFTGEWMDCTHPAGTRVNINPARRLKRKIKR